MCHMISAADFICAMGFRQRSLYVPCVFGKSLYLEVMVDRGAVANREHQVFEVPYILHFEPWLDALSLRFNAFR